MSKIKCRIPLWTQICFQAKISRDLRAQSLPRCPAAARKGRGWQPPAHDRMNSGKRQQAEQQQEWQSKCQGRRVSPHRCPRSRGLHYLQHGLGNSDRVHGFQFCEAKNLFLFLFKGNNLYQSYQNTHLFGGHQLRTTGGEMEATEAPLKHEAITIPDELSF